MSPTKPLLTLLTLLATACHPSEGPRAPEPDASATVDQPGDPADAPIGYPGELISTDELTGDFLARQRLEGKFGEREFKFEAVLQLRNGTLTVLGLTPFGTKAFVLEQTGTEVTFKALIDREIPFPPEYMLQDIHRAWLWHVRLPEADQPRPPGSSSVEVAGERVTETWTEDGLVQRTFERLDHEPSGAIRVDYIGGHRSGQPAKKVVLDNGWFGYRLEIQTTQWREL